MQLAEHWWRADSRVFPKKEVIAERVGLSTRQVQRHTRRLEELKSVKREERYRDGLRASNIYNLQGLVEKLAAIEPDIAKAKKLAAAAKKAGGLKLALTELE